MSLFREMGGSRTNEAQSVPGVRLPRRLFSAQPGRPCSVAVHS